MTVYQLIRWLSNFDHDTPVYIHGAARAWVTAAEAVRAATTDAEQDAADAAFEAADNADPVAVEQVDEWGVKGVVIS